MLHASNGRIIGIRHRIKRTAEGESRPTQVFILNQDGRHVTYDLNDETAELDFLLGQFPVTMRSITSEDDLENFAMHQVTFRSVKKSENPDDLNPKFCRTIDKQLSVATKVPAAFDGLRYGDKVAMVLGGSGDYLAFAMSNQAEKIGASVYRIPGHALKANRGERDKDSDASILAELLNSNPELFYCISQRDRDQIWLRETYRKRTEAMKARMACEQRLRQSAIGEIFCNQQGLYPQGAIEKQFDAIKASNRILQALVEEEKVALNQMTKAVKSDPVWVNLFEPLPGVGPAIAARLITTIGDIRMFRSKAKLKAFCGAHLRTESDGSQVFARRKRGVRCNWNNDARQALYLLVDQFNRRPETVWGQKLLEYKAKFRAKHPAVIMINGKKKYTDGHIHKMALWRTATKFVEWMFREWKALERKTGPDANQGDGQESIAA